MSERLSAAERKALRREIDHAVRRLREVSAAAAWFRKRLSEDEERTRQFSVCEAMIGPAAIAFRCSKRAEPGSRYCRHHGADRDA